MAKKRFNWLDGLLIGLVVLVVAGAAIWYFTKDNETAASGKTYEITLQFDQMTTDPHDFYKEGDTLYFLNRKAVLGTITSLEIIDRIVEEYSNEQERFIVTVDPYMKKIEMKVEASGVLAGGEFTVNGEKVYIGQTLYPQTDHARSVMTVWDIEEVAE